MKFIGRGARATARAAVETADSMLPKTGSISAASEGPQTRVLQHQSWKAICMAVNVFYLHSGDACPSGLASILPACRPTKIWGGSFSPGPESSWLLPKCRGFLSHAEAPWYLEMPDFVHMLKSLLARPVHVVVFHRLLLSISATPPAPEVCTGLIGH